MINITLAKEWEPLRNKTLMGAHRIKITDKVSIRFCCSQRKRRYFILNYSLTFMSKFIFSVQQEQARIIILTKANSFSL